LRSPDGGTVNCGSGLHRSSLEGLKLTLASHKSLDTARLDALVLLLRELGQPICRSSQILTQHRATGDYFVLNCLLDELVLTHAQASRNLSGEGPKLLVTPTQWKHSSRGHASSMTR
jgi:hypothetical protein